MDSNDVSAIATVGSTLVAIIAAVAAFRSAGAAKAAVYSTERLERARMERELARVANEVIALSVNVDNLADVLKTVHIDVKQMSNQPAPTPESPEFQAINAKKTSAGTMQERARAILDARNTWKGTSSDELMKQQIEVDGNVVHLSRVIEKFQRDLQRLDALAWDLSHQIRRDEKK